MKYKAVKGTRDFYPEDMAIRNWIVDAWRRVSIRNGFVEYDAPIFEYLDLYKAKSGEGIVSELFHLQDRGGRELAIRPEMTPTLARMVAARAQTLPRPIKWFSIPRCCRAEKPQRGRLREFFQWNIDILGSEQVISDAECIFVAADFFQEVGLDAGKVVIRISSRSLLAEMLRIHGFSDEQAQTIYGVLDKRDKVSPDVFEKMIRDVTSDAGQVDMLLELGQAHGQEGLERANAIVKDDAAGRQRVEELGELFELLDAFGVGEFCEFDMGVVRGLAYYTGTVFEAYGKGGLKRAICGGGRYDHLLKQVGGPPMTGVGYATSDVVIQDLLEELSLLPQLSNEIDFYAMDADDSVYRQMLGIVSQLRRRGLTVQFGYKRQSLGKQLKQAAAGGAKYALIVGTELSERGVVTIKNMKTGRQVERPLQTFLADPLSQPETEV